MRAYQDKMGWYAMRLLKPCMCRGECRPNSGLYEPCNEPCPNRAWVGYYCGRCKKGLITWVIDFLKRLVSRFACPGKPRA